MNKVILIGRLTRDPNYTTTQTGTEIARYTLAVDRIGEGADFISCVAFGKAAQFADKYLKKGNRIAITGRLRTGSYRNREGKDVYTTDVIIESQEFCESKSESKPAPQKETPKADEEGFMQIPDDIADELPFN